MEPIKTQVFFGDRYVPLAAALEQLGGKVEWDNVAKRATVHASGKTALVTLGDVSVEVNGQTVKLSQPPLVDENKLYVPEDFFQSVLGQNVYLA
jgi:N-acetylmuramoyl-L-alanine amidase